MWAEGHPDPFEQSFLRCDAEHVLGIQGTLYIVIPRFDIHCQEHLGSSAEVKHFSLIGLWVIDGFGVGIDVDCIVTHPKTLPILLSVRVFLAPLHAASRSAARC